MKTSAFYILLCLSLSVLISCKKNKRPLEEGTYSGTFTVKYSTETKTGKTTLSIEKGNYSCSGNSNRIPAGGSGKFSVDKGKIFFEEQGFWTADFDWNLILNGEYDYYFDGKKLIISAKKNGVGYYEYKLYKD